MNLQYLKHYFYHFFPKSCYLCGQDIPRIFGNAQLYPICDLCISCLPFVEYCCPRCGLEDKSRKDTLCGNCLRKLPAYERVVHTFWYEMPIQQMLQQYKFHQKLYWGAILAKFMLQRIQSCYADKPLPECIVPVPLHPERLKERGYNQTYELAKYLSHYLNIPLNWKYCQRTISTQPQSTLDRKARKKNVKNAFQSLAIPYQRIALLDDIMTTGETMSSLCRSIKAANPSVKIDVWCCARTKSLNVC